jgi:chromate transporter
VSVGYFVAGPAGAAAGCIALMTPSLLIIALLVFAGRRAEAPVVRRMVSAVTVAAAGMLAATTMPLARSSLVDLPHLLIAAGTLLALLRTRLPGALLMLLSAGAGLLLVVARQQ